MSLVRDRYWIDPAGLDAARAAHRSDVFRAIVREVVHGADGRATAAMLRGAGPEAVEQLDDLFASELPGTFSIVSEGWQGHTRNDFVVRAAYLDLESAAVCLLAAGQCLGDPEPHVDSIWIGLAEFQALGELASAGRTA